MVDLFSSKNFKDLAMGLSLFFLWKVAQDVLTSIEATPEAARYSNYKTLIYLVIGLVLFLFSRD